MLRSFGLRSKIRDISHAIFPLPIIAILSVLSKSNSSLLKLKSSDPLYQSTILLDEITPFS